jgi:hypothetical protein
MRAFNKMVFVSGLIFFSNSLRAQGVIFEEITDAYISSNTQFRLNSASGRYELFNASGEPFESGPVNAVKAFSEELIAIRTDDRWNYLSATDGIPEWSVGYDDVRGFSEGLAPVKQGSAWSYIDSEGNIAIPGDFQDTRPFRGGLAAVSVRGQYGYIDREGNFVIPPSFDNALDFSDGLAPVQINNEWGYINALGELVVAPEFDSAGYLTGDTAEVMIDGQPGFLNIKENSFRDYWPVEQAPLASTPSAGRRAIAEYSVQIHRPDSGHFQWMTPVNVVFNSQPEGVEIYLYTVWEWDQLKGNGIDPVTDDGAEVQPYARGETSRSLQLYMDKYFVVGRFEDLNKIYSLDVMGPDEVMMSFDHE